jgi:hypothetical protein
MVKFQWRGREENRLMREGALIMLAVAILFAVTGHCQTRVRQFPDTEILRRGNFVIAATTDGYLCYGTHEPLETFCHRAIELPEVLHAGK